MKRAWLLLSVGVVLIAFAIYKRTQSSRPEPDSPSNLASSLGPGERPPQDPVNGGYPFQDTSMLRPPAGANAAIYEFEDMECPACAHAYPIVHAAAAHYRIPVVRRDYPWSFHVWSFDAAVDARYIQDNLSAELADEYRRDVFASQSTIASKDDLASFTAKWFQSHGKSLPFVIDATGACKLEVESDRALGDKLGVKSTPCIFVVTQNKWIAVPYSDIDRLDQIVGKALAPTT